jgi:hypothetical protein
VECGEDGWVGWIGPAEWRYPPEMWRSGSGALRVLSSRPDVFWLQEKLRSQTGLLIIGIKEIWERLEASGGSESVCELEQGVSSVAGGLRREADDSREWSSVFIGVGGTI